MAQQRAVRCVDALQKQNGNLIPKRFGFSLIQKQVKFILLNYTVHFFSIKIGYDNTLKIADVGISIDENDVTGTVVGTPLFMAPEVLQSKKYDARADIYSLGLILWELWYGQRVSLGVGGSPSLLELLLMGTHSSRSPRHVMGCHHPTPQLQALMERCWEIEPKSRPDATACVKELDQILAFVS